MNGALGHVRGYVWPEGGDPRSTDSKKRAPLCVVVEFDDVDLGVQEKKVVGGSKVEPNPSSPEAEQHHGGRGLARALEHSHCFGSVLVRHRPEIRMK